MRIAVREPNRRCVQKQLPADSPRGDGKEHLRTRYQGDGVCGWGETVRRTDADARLSFECISDPAFRSRRASDGRLATGDLAGRQSSDSEGRPGEWAGLYPP